MTKPATRLRPSALFLSLSLCSGLAAAEPQSEAPGARDQVIAEEALHGTAATWWKPTSGTTAQIQLQGTIDTAVDAQVFDIDGFDAPASKISTLKAKGRKLVCYFSAGSYENWRPDNARFPAAVLGKNLDGWPGEKWLDVRQLATLKPIIAARMDMCKSKGFDAVDPDNVDGYTNDTGFRLTAADQLAYNQMLAQLAHERGLAVGLKNDLSQIPQLVDLYDFAVNEQCAEYDECADLKPFITRNKPVFQIEYNVSTSSFCSKSKTLGLSGTKKRLSLDAWLQRCP